MTGFYDSIDYGTDTLSIGKVTHWTSSVREAIWEKFVVEISVFYDKLSNRARVSALRSRFCPADILDVVFLSIADT